MWNVPWAVLRVYITKGNEVSRQNVLKDIAELLTFLSSEFLSFLLGALELFLVKLVLMMIYENGVMYTLGMCT